jgi:GTPase SAR1 family protein
MVKNPEFPPTTIGYVYHEMKIDDELVKIWDVGSNEIMHDLWPSFYRDVDVIYVLDPENPESLAQASCDLLIMTSEEELRNADFTVV